MTPDERTALLKLWAEHPETRPDDRDKSLVAHPAYEEENELWKMIDREGVIFGFRTPHEVAALARDRLVEVLVERPSGICLYRIHKLTVEYTVDEHLGYSDFSDPGKGPTPLLALIAAYRKSKEAQ